MPSIKSYPARNGDAYLIKADGSVRTAILVDGGYPMIQRLRAHFLNTAAITVREFTDCADPAAPETVIETTRDLGKALTLRLAPGGGYTTAITRK